MPLYTRKNYTDTWLVQWLISQGFWAHNWNVMKIHVVPIFILMIQSGHNFTHAMTAQLSWHVQNCGLIWWSFWMDGQHDLIIIHEMSPRLQRVVFTLTEAPIPSPDQTIITSDWIALLSQQSLIASLSIFPQILTQQKPLKFSLEDKMPLKLGYGVFFIFFWVQRAKQYVYIMGQLSLKFSEAIAHSLHLMMSYDDVFCESIFTRNVHSRYSIASVIRLGLHHAPSNEAMAHWSVTVCLF